MFRNSKHLALATAVAIILNGCSSLSTPSVEKNKKPVAYVVSNTAERYNGMKPYEGIWNAVTPLVLEKEQYMRCDFTPEVLVVLRDEGFELTKDISKADYKIEVDAVLCGPSAVMNLEDARSNYLLRKEIPLEDKILYKDFMKIAYTKEVPKEFSKVADAFKKDKELGMELFYKEMKNNKRFLHKIKVETDTFFALSYPWGLLYSYNKGSVYDIKNFGVLYPNKYKNIPEEDKLFVAKWLNNSLDNQVNIAERDNVKVMQLGFSLNNAANATGYKFLSDLGNASIALGAVGVLLKAPKGSAIDRISVTDIKTNKKAFIDRTYRFKQDFWWKRMFREDNIELVEEHLEDVFDKLND